MVNPRSNKRPFPLPRVGNTPGTDRYELKTVLEYRISRDPANPTKTVVYFLVEWVDYSLDKCTWESVHNLLDSFHIIKDFLQKRGQQIKIDPAAETMEIVAL